MPYSREQLLQSLSKNTLTLKKLGVKKIALSGSYARDEADETSDLDFVVELEPKTFRSYMETKFFLEDFFKIPVDLVLRDSIKPRLRESLLKDLVYVPGL